MRKLDFIVTGTGRCGTGFIARFLTTAGLPCGHEAFFKPLPLKRILAGLENHLKDLRGDSSWLAAPLLDIEPLQDALIIHLVRHPYDTIRSILKLGGGGLAPPRFCHWQLCYMPELTDFDEPTRVVYRYIRWNKMIEVYTAQRDSIFWKIEQEPYGLLGLLAERGLIDLAQIDKSNLFDNRKYNTKRNIAPPAFSLSDITNDQVRQDLLEITERYGYCWPHLGLEMDRINKKGD